MTTCSPNRRSIPVHRDQSTPCADRTAARARQRFPFVADFLKNAAEQFGFVPDRPASDMRLQARLRKGGACSRTDPRSDRRRLRFRDRRQWPYDTQAGLVPYRPGARAISPAVGYNQLLSTNSVSLLAEDGDRFSRRCRQKAKGLSGPAKIAMERKIEASQAHDRLQSHGPEPLERARPPRQDDAGRHRHPCGGARLDIGPLLQVQKLANSVRFARAKGYPRRSPPPNSN